MFIRFGRAKFTIEVFHDSDGACRLRVRADNGEIIASSEAYSSPQKARQTAEALAKATGLLLRLS